MDCAWRQCTASMNPMLLQHTLRGMCSNESQWVYAVFWRILPRNYPPPQWDTEGGMMDRSKGNKRNWILVWEDGFCNFSACGGTSSTGTSESRGSSNSFLSVRQQQQQQHLDEESMELTMNPELFFKMSHEVYNYGEGLMGKVAVDNSHKWVCREPLENEIGFLSSPWQNTIDPHPRTWEGQFKSGIQTIAIVAVQEGVLQLGSTQRIMEDLNFVLYVQRKFSFLHSIPGVLVPHPTSSTEFGSTRKRGHPVESFTPYSQGSMDQFLSPRTPLVTGRKRPGLENSSTTPSGHLKEYLSTHSCMNGYEQYRPECPSPPKALHTGLHQSPANITMPPGTPLTPSMTSLQALLSKLPSVTVPADNSSGSLSLYPSNGRFEVGNAGVGGGACPPIPQGSEMQRTQVTTTEGGGARVDGTKPEKAATRCNNSSNNNNNCNSMLDSFDNFTEFGIQEALENGDSSYTSFLNEICS